MARDLGASDIAQQARSSSSIRHIQFAQHHALVDESDFPHFSLDLVNAAYLDAQNLLVGSTVGRGTVWFLRNPDQQCQKQYVLRSYLRGGLVRHFLRDQYFHFNYRTSRAWQEFNLLQQLNREGFAVPRPVVAVVKRSGMILRSFLMTERIPGAKDLFECLSQQAVSDEVWQRIGRAIGAMHQRSVYHHDLNLRNILLDDSEQPWLIDFDKCAIRKSGSWEDANLARLKRSFIKEKLSHPRLHWHPDNYEQLLVGYLKSR